ncbi:MAG: hypothetical protein ACOZCO_02115 [Bacteroidota bacterium]
MRTLLNIFLVFSPVVVHAQLWAEVIPANDWEKYGWKGKVYTVKEVKYHAVEKNGKVLPGKRAVTNMHDEMDTGMEFDKTGKLVKETSFYFEKKEIAWSHYIYKYDGHNRIISTEAVYSNRSTGKTLVTRNDDSLTETSVSYESDPSKPYHTCVTKYDSALRMTGIRHYSDEGKLTHEWIYRYDIKGRKTHELSHNPEKPISGFIFEYDDVHLKKTIFQYRDTSKTAYSHTVEYYSQDGLLLTDTTYGSSGFVSVDQYTYDSLKNLTETKIYWDGELKFHTRYNLTYDKNKNVTKMIVYRFEHPEYVIQRDIRYF